MRYSVWSVPFENPFFAIYEIINDGTAYEKHVIVKLCKSMQTVKKYVLNSDKPMGWSIWCKDVYPGIEAFVQIGDDVNSLSFRNKIEKLKQNKMYIAL
jgi:hypothetical protein